MRVFVTGGTGVLGRPVVRQLAEAGHTVRALARSTANRHMLRALGAEPAEADLFDRDSLVGALAGSDAVLHLATRIPPRSEARSPYAWIENDRIRREGTRHLVDAALMAGVRAFVYPGAAAVYADGGPEWIGAPHARVDAPPLLASSLAAEAEVERFTLSGGRGVVLRLGWLYGPGARSTADTVDLARRGFLLLAGAEGAYHPSLWADDAAHALVAALDRAPAGVFDVADDDPLPRGELARAVADAVGRKSLFRPPVLLVRLAAGRSAAALARSQRVSNRRFREATGWAPHVPDARQGWRRIAETLGQPETAVS